MQYSWNERARTTFREAVAYSFMNRGHALKRYILKVVPVLFGYPGHKNGIEKCVITHTLIVIL
jgi:hypothetical protein